MPSYTKYLIILISILFFASCNAKSQASFVNKEERINFVKVEPKPFDMEDYYIMYALEMEHIRFYEDAKEVYLKLFENTNKYEYLVNYVTLAIQFQEYENVKSVFEKYFIENIKEEEILVRIYSFALLKLQEIDKALKEASKLIKKYENGINYELLGTIYIAKEDFKNAHFYLEKALKYDFLLSVVQAKASLEFFQLNMKDTAINTLKSSLKKSEYDFNLALQLITFYNDLKKQDEIKSLLKEMFLQYKDGEDALQINKTISLILQNFEIEEFISFLEQNSIEDDLLLELYQRANQLQKAYELLKKLYEINPNPEYLGQQAIIEFELAQNKKDVLPSVIEKFELALQKSTSHIFQNYLAYLLIDYDLDVKKGLILVDKALQQDPTNIAYIDTLAWGQYKMKNCKDAYKNMKQIVDEIGLNDEEIKLHWEKIKECNK